MTDELRDYSVLVEFRQRPDCVAPITDEAIDTFMDLLLPYSAAVSGGPAHDDYGARVSITAAPGALSALVTAANLVHKAATHAGLPAGHIIRLEATREDVLEEDLARPTLPDLVSAPEAAEILGVTAQRIHTLAAGNSSFPEPAYRLRTGRIWFRAAIEKFAADWQRKPGRPRKPADAARSAAPTWSTASRSQWSPRT